MDFHIIANSGESRAGELRIRNLIIETPIFMPIATRGSVRTIKMHEVAQIGYKLILSNTYHFIDRPGAEKIAEAGRWHSWTGWSGALLTDSGGFQAFSLGGLRRFTEEGIIFKSVVDGRNLKFTPESVIRAQSEIGSDIMMPLDHCPPLPASSNLIRESVERTTRWAERAMNTWKDLSKERKDKSSLFLIVQGGVDVKERFHSLNALKNLGADGYALGGLAVGESFEERSYIIKEIAPFLPKYKPRYVMGVGYPEDIVTAVRSGIDMFDCVIPTREARHGRLYRWTEPGKGRQLLKELWYETISIHKSEWRSNHDCIPYAPFKGWGVRWDYLSYLYSLGDENAHSIGTYMNLQFYFELMQHLRRKICDGTLLD